MRKTEFDYDVYGTYYEYEFQDGENSYLGYENVDEWDEVFAFEKARLENQSKFMQFLWHGIYETDNGMFFVEVLNKDDFEMYFNGITTEDMKEFFREIEEYPIPSLEINFTIDDFENWKNGIFDFDSVKEEAVICYGDFLVEFNCNIKDL